MTKQSSISIVLADDHPMFRKGLRDTIDRNTPFNVVGEASDGEEAYRVIVQHKPTIAILDVEMPKMNGLDVANRINDENLTVSVVILSMYEEYGLFNKAIDAGVKGYILKESAVHDILSGISKVAAGEYYFSPSLSGYLMGRAKAAELNPAPATGTDTLTGTEKQVLHLIATSLSSRDIAERLCVSIRTVETHRYNICHKLQLNGSYALLRYALANKDTL
ncbi:MAG: response regulator transcription factor [Bacteroidota bacterium]